MVSPAIASSDRSLAQSRPLPRTSSRSSITMRRWATWASWEKSPKRNARIVVRDAADRSGLWHAAATFCRNEGEERPRVRRSRRKLLRGNWLHETNASSPWRRELRWRGGRGDLRAKRFPRVTRTWDRSVTRWQIDDRIAGSIGTSTGNRRRREVAIIQDFRRTILSVSPTVTYVRFLEIRGAYYSRGIKVWFLW